jgi:predicted lipoprotein
LAITGRKMESSVVSTTRELRQRRRRVAPWLLLGVAGAAMCYAFPPVRFVRVGADGPQSSGTRATGPFRADVAAKEFWDGPLSNAAGHATSTEDLLAAIGVNSNAARDKHSRRVGVGGSHYYFIRGAGRVVRIDVSGISIAIGDDDLDAKPAILIETGNIFGNAVRDGTGLLDVNRYPNSQDFNQLSEQLNKLVESRVLPVLRERAAIGSQVQFAGVAEVEDEGKDLRPLRVVPILAEVR